MGASFSQWWGGEGSWLTASSIEPVTLPRAQEELLHTEQTYYLALANCVEHVIAPLRRQDGSAPSLPVETQRRIFGNIEDVVRLHRSFLRDLTLLMEESQPTYEPLFRKYYTVAYQPERLQQVLDDSSALENYLDDKRNVMKGKDLSAVLIMPIQRLPRYILLLQTMKEKAASTNSMKDDLQKSADLMKETTQYVNEEKKIAIQMTQLRQIESSLLHAEDHPPLVRRGRWVVDQSVLGLQEKKKQVHCYVCNDLFILAVTSRMDQLNSVMKGYVSRRPSLSSSCDAMGRLTPGGVARHLSSLGSVFTPVEWTDLDQIKIMDVRSSDCIITIASRTAKWSLEFPSLPDLEKWHTLLLDTQKQIAK